MILNRLKALVQAPKSIINHWINHQNLLFHNPEVFIDFPIVWKYDNINAIRIAQKVCIGAFSEIVVLSKSEYSDIAGELVIEERSVIGAYANIRAAGGGVFIGKNSLIAQHVSLIASGHNISLEQPYQDSKWDELKTGIYIDENVWIGANSVILPGCRIGKNSIIGAGSVVTKNIPDNEIWVGVPAQKLRAINLT